MLDGGMVVVFLSLFLSLCFFLSDSLLHDKLGKAIAALLPVPEAGCPLCHVPQDHFVILKEKLKKNNGILRKGRGTDW